MAKTLEQVKQEELCAAEQQAVLKLLAQNYAKAMEAELKLREESNIALRLLRQAERKTKAAAQAWAEKHQFLFKFPQAVTALTEMEQDELQNALEGQKYD